MNSKWRTVQNHYNNGFYCGKQDVIADEHHLRAAPVSSFEKEEQWQWRTREDKAWTSRYVLFYFRFGVSLFYD